MSGAFFWPTFPLPPSTGTVAAAPDRSFLDADLPGPGM